MLLDRVEEILDKYVRPELATHNGNIKVVRIDGDTLFVQLLGECMGCASAYFTLDGLVEKEITANIPEIQHVCQEDIDTDFYNEAMSFIKGLKEKGEL